MKHPVKSLLGFLLLVCLLTAAARALINPQVQAPPAAKPAAATSAAPQNASPGRGDVVFQQNCGRCHNSPQGFSSRISGTVSKHMRVRANLSDADYRELMRFLNP